MEIVYVVIKFGVYRHEIGGVFRLKDKAIEAANILKAEEPDNYHDFEVVPFYLDIIGDKESSYTIKEEKPIFKTGE